MEHVGLAIELLKEADAVTVTTKHMRDLVQGFAPGVPTYILPNVVKFAEWQGQERWLRWEKDWIVLGLTGSITHHDDWKVLKDVLPRLLREHTNVALLLQGFVPDYLKNLSIKYPARVYADESFRDYPKYPEVIRQADVILCPVDPDDRFNLAKSAIKAVEGMACGRPLSDGNMGGAAIVASPLPYYGRTVGWGNKRGIVCDHDPDSWYSALSCMINEPDKREHWQRRGWIWVHQNRSIERKWSMWWNAYQEIYRRKRK
jgi:glycosyltransferase involved in cell wall biosynthesis